MTGDVRTLLHDTAETPSRAPDIGAALRTARARRRRHRGAGVLAAVVVFALAGGIFVSTSGGSGDDAQVAISPRQSLGVPDGWKRVVTAPGITIALPPGWDSYDFGRTDVAQRRVSVGTSAPTDTSVMTACTSDGHQPTVAGTWLTIWEYPASVADPTMALPDGQTLDRYGVVDRPADFREAPRTNGRCAFVGNADHGDLSASFAIIAFRDAGRLFVARTIVAYPVVPVPDVEAAPRLSQASEVLNTLRIEQLPGAPTTVSDGSAPTTTLPLTTATTLPAFAPSTDDERAIDALVQRWLGDSSDESQLATIEDGPAILDAIHAGIAQYPDRVPFYTGAVNSITFDAPDRASIRYTLLYRGQPAFVRDGDVLRVNGQWKVSRDTECAFLAQGGITCP